MTTTMTSMEFHPNWTSAPGDTITDILQEHEISIVQFAEQIGQTLDDTHNLLQGRSTITIAVARKLERVLGASVEFWMARDFQFRQDVARLNNINKQWLADFPLGDMINFGWIKPVPFPKEEVDACLRYFDVPNVQAWNEKYGSLRAAFRTSLSIDSRPAAVAAWLRQGEIVADAITCKPWNAKQFQESLQYIRSLTRLKKPDQFIPKLQECCSENGVSVTVVRAPNGCRASGAARFISTDKALLQFSFRYLSDDQFWFTFFHEAGHLILHGGESGIFLEGVDTPSDTLEMDANEFAERIIIPQELKTEFLSIRDVDTAIRFAVRLGISPGIVVGQLQYFGKIKPNQWNNLKRYYKWGD